MGLVDEKNPGAKFENLVALSLVKHVYAKVDYFAENYKLCYLRTKEQKEVDFALVKNDAIERIIEVKHSKSDISRDLLYFHKKYNIPATQVVKQLKHSQIRNNIEIVDAMKFLQALYL